MHECLVHRNGDEHIGEKGNWKICFSSAHWLNIAHWPIHCIGTQRQTIDYYTTHTNVAHIAKGHDHAGGKGNWKTYFSSSHWVNIAHWPIHCIRTQRNPIAKMIIPQAAREKETPCDVVMNVSRIAAGIATPARRQTGKSVVELDIG